MEMSELNPRCPRASPENWESRTSEDEVCSTGYGRSILTCPMEGEDPFRRNSIPRTPPKNTAAKQQNKSEVINVENQEKVLNARFLILKRWEGQDFFKVSPFLIRKALYGLVGNLKQIKKTKDGLFLETTSAQQSRRLQEMNKFINLDVSVKPHNTLNTSRGVIFCRDLLSCTEEELVQELGHLKVIAVKRIKNRINGQLEDSPVHILTFGTPDLPTSIKAAFHHLPVKPYVPAPMRCFRCQNFGHSANKCTKPQVCICGKPLHEGQPCGADLVCVNCGGKHNARSKNCSVYKSEMAIQEMKIREKISYFEAKKRVGIQTSRNVSYAQVAREPSTGKPEKKRNH